MLQLKITQTTVKTWHRQIKDFILKWKRERKRGSEGAVPGEREREARWRGERQGKRKTMKEGWEKTRAQMNLPKKQPHRQNRLSCQGGAKEGMDGQFWVSRGKL